MFSPSARREELKRNKIRSGGWMMQEKIVRQLLDGDKSANSG
jgi:hypothetical protein